MAKPQRSTAQAVLDRFGLDICREYVKRPADGCPMERCEKGHADCAHILRGPCLAELVGLVKVMQ